MLINLPEEALETMIHYGTTLFWDLLPIILLIVILSVLEDFFDEFILKENDDDFCCDFCRYNKNDDDLVDIS